MQTFQLFYSAVIGGIAASQAIEAYPRLMRLERVVVWWWSVVCVLCVVSIVSRRELYVGAAGVLMAALGLLVALNVRRVADQLATREAGFWIFRRRSSARAWRFCGIAVSLFGASWAADPAAVLSA